MIIVRNRNQMVAAWVGRRIGGSCATRGWRHYAAIGFMVEDRLIGGVVFHNWNPERRCIEASMASVSGRSFGATARRAVAEYAERIGVNHVLMWTDLENERFRRTLQIFGATEYPILELGRVLLVVAPEDWAADPRERPHKHGLIRCTSATKPSESGGSADGRKHRDSHCEPTGVNGQSGDALWNAELQSNRVLQLPRPQQPIF